LAVGRKLKVFQAQFGFDDTVVAAASQAAALRAWGTHQNLFASGDAKVTTDKAAVAAAIAHPGTPLRRAVGTAAPFTLEPTSLPRVPDAPKTAASRPHAKSTTNTSARSPADRSALDAAEKVLHELVARRKTEEAEFRCEQDELDERRQTAQVAYVDARKAANVNVVDARSAYRKAGGSD
jgi:hypothetical protein